MSKVKKAWDLLNDDQRRFCVDKIISFFAEERDEEIGVIAAESLLDMFLECASGIIYNRGVEDAKKTVRKRFDDVEMDLDLLLNK